MTVLMELLVAFWCWLTGQVEPGNQYKVWDILWASDGEWLAKPPGQHRDGFSVEQVMAEVKRRDREAARLRASEQYRLVAAA